jgi:hypothetical protein
MQAAGRTLFGMCLFDTKTSLNERNEVPMNKDEIIKLALEEFVDCVQSRGGVNKLVKDGVTTIYLCGEPSWTDLGLCYILACGALGRKPIITEV